MDATEARVRMIELAQKHAPNHEAESDTIARARTYYEQFVADAKYGERLASKK